MDKANVLMSRVGRSTMFAFNVNDFNKVIGRAALQHRTPNREVLDRSPQAATCSVLEQDTLIPFSTHFVHYCHLKLNFLFS